MRHYFIHILLISAVAFVNHAAARAQAAGVVELTLDDAVARARAASVDAAVALDELRSAYWEYRTYRAELLPEVTFEATLPHYAKQYSTYMDSNGAFSFVRTNYLEAVGQLSLTQNIWLTGGTLSLSTSLDLIKEFDSGSRNRFMSIPVALTLNQPVFGVNNVKWNRRISPVRYEEAKAAFLSATEDVAMNAITYYFNLLMADEDVATARQNLANAEKLYSFAQEKREMGRISKNDLLQMELNLLNARATLTDAESTRKSAMFQLASFLDLEEDAELRPVVPAMVPDVEVTFADALDKALANNKFAKNLRRRQLEADYEVAKAKGDMRQINLYAQVGYTGAGHNAGDSYRGLRDNQVVEVGVRVPLIDWGKRRGRVRVAQSNREVVQSRLRKETQDFNRDLFVLVERFANQGEQVRIALRADTIASQRYRTNVETYLIGKISTLDLNDSQASKDDSRRQYISNLYRYWSYYYQLRSLTLWDYERREPLMADFEKIIK